MIKRVNYALFAGFCILIVLAVSIAACTTTDSGKNKSVTAPAQPIQTSIVPASMTTEPDITQVQRTHPLKTDIPTTIPTQQLSGPVSLTINSAKKQLSLRTLNSSEYSDPVKRNVFLVLDITIKNTNAQEGFNFTRNSITVDDLEHGTFATPLKRLRETVWECLENPFIFPITVKQGDAISGQGVFEVRDAAEYRVNLVDTNKTVIASQIVSYDSLLNIRNPVDLTIDSASKVRNYPTTAPMPGHIFLILNVTVKNNDVKDGFIFSWESTDIRDIRGSDYAPHTLNNGPNLMKNLKNPIPPEKNIKQNDSITGQIIFGIADSTEYRLTLIDANRTVIASRNIHVE